jgi:hypothetical protein
VPSEYVWVVGKATLSPSGSFTDTRNSANWSNEMPILGSAVQVTERTVPAAVSRSMAADQPGITSVRADATSGSVTLNWVVREPFSDSPGTRKVTTAVDPGAGSSASACTCADAGPVPDASPMPRATPVAATVKRARVGALKGEGIELSLS